jgi:hypothetical protein
MIALYQSSCHIETSWFGFDIKNRLLFRDHVNSQKELVLTARL